MAESSIEFIGYIRYDGIQVAEGIIDARSGAIALNGFDSALRFFIAQENAELSTASLPVPVLIESGSWTAFIPENLAGWLKTAFGAGAIVYATTAAEVIAMSSIDEFFR
jgi:hypothetical protein